MKLVSSAMGLIRHSSFVTRHFLAVVFREFANPDVSEANRVGMVLETEGQLVRMGRIGRTSHVIRRACELHIVLDQHSVVEHRNARGAEKLAGAVEARAVKD